ncbi:MAG: lipocalin family protein [Bacteroidia bacterium]
MLLFSSCEKPTRELIIGTWKIEDITGENILDGQLAYQKKQFVNAKFKFEKNHQYSLTQVDTRPLTGKWTYDDIDNVLEIRYYGQYFEQYIVAHISEDKLLLKINPKNTYTFTYSLSRIR